jgi:DNA primase
MTDQRGLSFMDAVKELASEAGMEVPAPDPRAAEGREQQAIQLHDVMAAAQEWFAAKLAGPDGAPRRVPISPRAASMRAPSQRFGFGYAPEGRQALKTALSQFPEGMLIEAGLRIAVDDEGAAPYDRFRGRLMLPIEDARGRVIAFGGRILDAARPTRPSTSIRPTRRCSTRAARSTTSTAPGPASAPERADVVVEGYMDVIALAAAGIDGCGRPARHRADRAADRDAVAAGRNADPVL